MKKFIYISKNKRISQKEANKFFYKTMTYAFLIGFVLIGSGWIITERENNALYANINASMPRDIRYCHIDLKNLTEAQILPKNKVVATINDSKEPFIKVLKEKCAKFGIKEDYCWKDLLAIAMTETGGSLNCLSVGDSGKSKGAFQIHQGYHPEITDKQAFDFAWAAEWTLKRLLTNHYPILRSVAIRKHNGSPTNPKTLAYLNKVNDYKDNLK